MTQAWLVMGETYLLTIIVSLLVAFVIHMMTIMIRKFGATAKPLPVSAELMPETEIPTDPDEITAIAIAAALRGGNNEGR